MVLSWILLGRCIGISESRRGPRTQQRCSRGEKYVVTVFGNILSHGRVVNEKDHTSAAHTDAAHAAWLPSHPMLSSAALMPGASLGPVEIDLLCTSI